VDSLIPIFEENNFAIIFLSGELAANWLVIRFHLHATDQI